MTVPNRAVNLTAGSVDVTAFMAALHADIAANSDWTITNQYEIDTASPGLGSYSFTARNLAGDKEINYRNNGTQAAPSTTQIRLGVNPDVADSAIADSRNPSASATQFSGTDHGRLMDIGAISTDVALDGTEFMHFEWDDALITIFKNAARTKTQRAWAAGEVFAFPLTGLAAPLSSTIRLDGNGVLPSVPDFNPTSSHEDRWISTNGTWGSRPRIRLSEGNTAGASVITGFAWTDLEGYCVNNSSISTAFLTTDVAHVIGAASERVPGAWHYRATGVAVIQPILKYIKSLPGLIPPLSVWKAPGGADRYMGLGDSGFGAFTPMVIPIPATFNPLP